MGDPGEPPDREDGVGKVRHGVHPHGLRPGHEDGEQDHPAGNQEQLAWRPALLPEDVSMLVRLISRAARSRSRVISVGRRLAA